jgi:hypothetical protein
MDLTGIGSIADLAKGIMDRIWPPDLSAAEKATAQLRLQEILEKRETALIEAQRSVIVSEMEQGDRFTKRARPMLVYAGLCFILMVHVLFPMVTWFTKQTVPDLSLPEEFWWAWSGVCGIWVMGRSAEKMGKGSKLVGMITGK